MAAGSVHFRDHTHLDVPRQYEAFFAVELVLLHVSPVYYGFGVPRGDRSPVVIIPGFLGSDAYLTVMYAWLKRLGYVPYYSGIRFNADCPDRLVKHTLRATVERARRDTGRKVHLIGHSLGGMIARATAAQMPDDVASVITLGAPLRGMALHRNVFRARELVRQFIRLKHGRDVLPGCYTGRCTCQFAGALRGGLSDSIAQTAIYTQHDGVVDWRYCLTGDTNVDVEVSGTHLGLAISPSVYSVIAHRLATTGDRQLAAAD